MATALDSVYKLATYLAWALAVAFAASCQAETWHVVPSITVGETLTDNVALTSNQRQSDLVTDITPGLRIDGTGGRAKVSFDYQLHNLIYAQDSRRNTTQNFLNATGTLEAVENWFFVDARGSITQQSISAFGTQSPSDANITSNRTETSTYQVSPFIRGKFGSAADYQLRYNWTTTRSQSSVLSNAQTGEWIGNVKGQTGLAVLGWSVDAGSLKADYGNAQSTEADHVRGSLSYQIDPQIRMTVNVGREANNYATLTKQSTSTSGFGLDWAPSETTSLSAMKEKRFFGDGHMFSFKHRTPLSAWEYSDSKDVSVLPTQVGSGSLGSIFDLLFFLNASQIPDPIERAQRVSLFLQAAGIPPNAQVVSGFLSSNAFVERRRQASFALIGVSNTVTFVATQSDRHALSTLSSLLGDFANTSDVVQRGFSTNWAHKLTPLSSITLTLGSVRSVGSGSVNEDSKQQTLNLSFATQLGPKTYLSLGARHTNFDSSAVDGYRENALLGSLSVRF